MQPNRTVIRLLVTLVLAGGAVVACTVPVFRYALDHWPPDPYRLEAPAGWLEGEQGAGLRKLLAEKRVKLEINPLAQDGAPARLLMPGDGPEVWSGVLDESAASLLDSPARRDLVRRILSGESMVWIMVTSGDEEKDREFEKTITERLDYLQTVAAIPEQDPTDPENKLGPGPELRVGFSFIRIARNDPAEQVFLRMLAGQKQELLAKQDPFGAVVFGRGRVLGAWPAEELDEEGLDEVSLFLLGACSCRVKFQNPGWDLALTLDWDESLLASQMEADQREEPGKEVEIVDSEPAREVPAAPELIRIDGGANPSGSDGEKDERPARASRISGPIISALVALLGVMSCVCVFASRSRAKGS